VLDPLLELDQFEVQPGQLAIIVLAFELTMACGGAVITISVRLFR
jgi:hypothetical protein